MLQTYLEVRQRWQQHQAALEAGQIGTVSFAFEQHCKTQPCFTGDVNLENIPSKADLEWSFRVLKDKAYGLDCLPACVWKISPKISSAILYPLLLNSTLFAQMPFQSCGGMHFELYKGKGTHDQCDNSRAILLFDAVSKAMRKPVR